MELLSAWAEETPDAASGSMAGVPLLHYEFLPALNNEDRTGEPNRALQTYLVFALNCPFQRHCWRHSKIVFQVVSVFRGAVLTKGFGRLGRTNSQRARNGLIQSNSIQFIRFPQCRSSSDEFVVPYITGVLHLLSIQECQPNEANEKWLHAV